MPAYMQYVSAPTTKYAPQAHLCVEQPAKVACVGTYRPAGHFTTERGVYALSLHNSMTWVELSDTRSN